jgi:hypothetical protein
MDYTNYTQKKTIQIIQATSSNQIKLADGINTTFDGSNPDIRFSDGGLIAPNGKKSNLTPEQYRLVRTPEFKAWFGDWEKINGYNFYEKNNGSRVIEFDGLNDFKKDATYEPLVVYHTTTKDFNEFSLNAPRTHDAGYYGKGFYFGLDAVRLKRLYGGNVKPYFLNIQNPFIIDEFTPREFAKNFGVYVEYEPTERNSEDLRNELIKKGYDGVIALNNIWGIEIVAFYPEQIKLADGTNTTFDGSNPDIRFSNGGKVWKEYNPNLFGYGGLIETLTTEQVEQKLGRKLHWWNDDVVLIKGVRYKKVFLRPEYQVILS